MTKLLSISTASRSSSNQDPIAGNRYSWHAQLGRAVAARTAYQVECWSLDVTVRRTHDEIVDGVRYRVFPSDRFVMPYREWSTELLRALRDEMRQHQVIVHLHSIHSWLSYAIGRSFPRARIVAHSHGTVRPPIQRLANWRRLPFAPLLVLEQILEQRALRSIRHSFVVNSASGQYFRRHGVPITFCPMAPNLEQLQPHRRADARQRLQLSLVEPILLAVGGFVKTKRLELLLATFAEIARRRPARVILIGHTYDRAYRAIIERQARQLRLSDRLTVIDHIPREQLSWYYAAADALLVTSTTDEGGPLVVLEACAFGTPVIATPVGFIPDFAPRAKRLITVSQPEPRRFSDDVQRVLEAPRPRPTILWTWDDVVRAVVPIYSQLI